LKINTAFLLCTAFIFRILFVNIGIISSLNTRQNNNFINTCFSTAMKRKKHFEAINNSESYGYSAAEICEEDSDDDNLFKSNPFFLIQVLYSTIAGKIKNTLEKISFYKYFSCASSKNKHAELRVLRI
jgi:hypothetical protein